MQLVDEEDDLARGRADLVHHALHALFELAAILRTRNEAREVERDHAPLAQRLRNLALDHALRETFGDRRLADARLADERRVVLRAARENLDHAFDLVRASDHRIELVVAREGREVAAVRIERRRLRLALGRHGLPFGAEQRGGLDAHLGRIDAQVREHAGRNALALTDEAEQEVLRADVVVVELTRLFEGELDHALRARGEHHLLLNGLPAAAHDRFDFLAYLCEVHAEGLEHFGREALPFGNDAEQDVLGSDVVVAEPLRFFLRQDDAASGSLGERFPH